MIETIIQGIIIIIFESICCKIFFGTFSEERIFKFYWINNLLIPALVFSSLLISVINISNFPIKCIFTLLFLFMIICIFYNLKFLHLLFLTIIYYGLELSIDYLAVLLLKNFYPESYIQLSNDIFISTLFALLCKMLLFIFVIIIRKKWNKEDSFNTITDTEWIRFCFFPVLTVLILIFLYCDCTSDIKHAHTLVIIAFALTIINFIVFYLIRNILNRENEIQNERLINERTKQQMNLYHSIKVNYDMQRKQIHEYKNQLTCIQGLLLENNINEALSYLTTLTGTLATQFNIINTNNPVANAVINQKYHFAKEKGIAVTIISNDLSNLKMEEQDLVILLSNLLDNAIEACEKLKGNKIIQFKILNEFNQMILSVKNPFLDSLKIIDNKIITTKHNKNIHGIGLLNIQNIIKKYNGNHIIQCKNGFFYFSAIFPNSDK